MTFVSFGEPGIGDILSVKAELYWKCLHLFPRLVCSFELLKHLFLLHMMQQILISFTVKFDLLYSYWRQTCYQVYKQLLAITLKKVYPGNVFSLQISNRWKLMSQAPVQKKSKNETNKKPVQQSGTAILASLALSASMLFPVLPVDDGFPDEWHLS